jgi:hypothetical protein
MNVICGCGSEILDTVLKMSGLQNSLSWANTIAYILSKQTVHFNVYPTWVGTYILEHGLRTERDKTVKEWHFVETKTEIRQHVLKMQ